MAGSLVADVVETGASARQLRYYAEGTVIAVDTQNHVARVDVQANLPNSSIPYLEGVPYPAPQSPPPINAKVRLAYTTPDPHSVYIAGVGMPGQITNSQLSVIGNVVNSLNAIGSPQLIGSIQIAAGSGLSISQVSQTITLSNAGVISLNALVGAVTLVAGTGISLGISGQNITITNALPGFTNPMTTSQDIIVGGAAGAPGRLGIGTSGQVLGITSGTVGWINNPAGFVNPMTTVGDIIIGGTAGAAQRLGIGSNGQVLGITSGSPAWIAGNSTTFPSTRVYQPATPYTISSANQFFLIINNQTSMVVNLPAAGHGTWLMIKNSQNSVANNITLNPTGTDTLDTGIATIAQGHGYLIVSELLDTSSTPTTFRWYLVAQF